MSLTDFAISSDSKALLINPTVLSHLIASPAVAIEPLLYLITQFYVLINIISNSEILNIEIESIFRIELFLKLLIIILL